MDDGTGQAPDRRAAMVRPPESVQAIDRVIAGGYCVGCGVCAASAPGRFSMTFTQEGLWQARAIHRTEQPARDISTLCPMTGQGPDETQIAAALWPALPEDHAIGRHRACGVGWVEEGEFRARGSSGGLLSWLATRLLEAGEVDAVVHVVPTPPSDPDAPLFGASVSASVAEVARGARSRYHPSTLHEAVAQMREGGDRRYAFIGLPCSIKALRLMMRDDPVLARRVRFCLGLICGHLKSRAFGELLAWQRGLHPDALRTIDFREKLEGQPAWQYGFRASDGDREVAAPMREVFGQDWGLGLFKPLACEFCDDVIAECADVAVGDAWLPDWIDDWRGTNVFVVRDETLAGIIEAGRASGALRIEDATPETVAQSQESGLRHRREGLSWRLWRADRAGRWRPKKRLAPSAELSRQRRRIYDLRIELSAASHRLFLEARRHNDLQLFLDGMDPIVRRYRAAYALKPARTPRSIARALVRRILPDWAVARLRRVLGRGSAPQ